MNVERHQGRVALVTGTGSGIGRATAVRLAAEGATVVCLDLNEKANQETQDKITANGGQALAVTGSVTSKSDIQAAVEATDNAYGALHLAVNCAGIVTMASLASLAEDDWDRVVDVNLKSVFLVSQAIAPLISRSGGGAIVNLSTVEADVVVSGDRRTQPHYNASKGGVKTLTKALAVELAENGIRVNCVAPGPVKTDFAGIDFDADGVKEFLNARLLIQRPAAPEDIAAAVSFLLSDEAAYITGVQLPVDGGWLAR